MLEFGETIRPRDLFPVLIEGAAVFVEQDPFAFALAAVLDRGTTSDVIWTVPYYLQKELGDLNPARLERMSVSDLYSTFRRLPKKPRYITDAPRTVKELAQIVVREFGGNVAKIWLGKSSAQVKQTFRRIYGVGPGIASMIVILLERCYGIRFGDIDHASMDVKPDVHVQRVFKRLGFISAPDEKAALEAARGLNPAYPAALDPPSWIIGKRWCFPTSPDCHNCPMSDVCPKVIR